jgi:hypothetical protein
MKVSGVELAGFVAIVAAFVAVMAIFDVKGQSWTAVALLAGFLVVLVAYRAFLRRRRA